LYCDRVYFVFLWRVAQDKIIQVEYES